MKNSPTLTHKVLLSLFTVGFLGIGWQSRVEATSFYNTDIGTGVTSIAADNLYQTNPLNEGSHRSYGVAFQNGGSYTISVADGATLTITNKLLPPERNYGIAVLDGAVLNVDGNVKLDVLADGTGQARGVRNNKITSGATINFNGDIDITATVYDSAVVGLDTWGGTTTVNGKANIVTNRQATDAVMYEWSNAVQAGAGGIINFNGATSNLLATSEGYTAQAVQVADAESKIYFNSPTTVITSESDHGANGVAGSGTVYFTGKDVSINANILGGVGQKNSVGVMSNLEAADTVENLAINVTGSGVDTGNPNYANGTAGIYSLGHTVNINAQNLVINVHSGDDVDSSTAPTEYSAAHGIRADYAGTVTIGANTDTVVNVEENYKGASSLSAGIGGTAGTITILGDASISNTSTVPGGNLAMYAEAGGEINLGQAGKNVSVNGNVLANGGSINTVLGTAASNLTGSINGSGTTTLTMYDGAEWNVTGDSTLTTLEGNKAKININDLETSVQIGTNNNADVTLHGNSAVANQIAKGDVEDNLQSFADTVAIAEGNKQKTITTEAGDVAGAFTAVTDGNGKLQSVKEAVNFENKAIGDAGVALKAHWRAQMNDINKRLGDLRNADGEQGVWTRMVRGEAKYESVKAQYNQYQLGYDHKVGGDGWVLGGAVTYSDGESTFYKGSTDDKSTAFAIYGSKLNDDGSFIDLIARYAHLKSDVSVTGNKADYSTDGFSMSAEYGKRITDDKGFWVEPQVELTYGKLDGANYVLDGRRVHQGSMDSFIGRLGLAFGKDIKDGNVYARASYLYDFDGDTKTTFSKDGVSRTIKEDLGGGWWEVGLGTNINLSKATYVYADVEKTFSGRLDTDWQWNLGVRYSF